MVGGAGDESDGVETDAPRSRAATSGEEAEAGEASLRSGIEDEDGKVLDAFAGEEGTGDETVRVTTGGSVNGDSNIALLTS